MRGGDEHPRAFYELLPAAVAHVRRTAQLARKAKDGATERAHLELLAEQGNREAHAALAVPECPEELECLVDWAWMLNGRSGVGFGALAPLSHREVEAWARLRREYPEPYEVDALMVLDAVMLSPDPPAGAAGDGGRRAEPEPGTTPEAPWPTRRRPPEFMPRRE